MEKEKALNPWLSIWFRPKRSLQSMIDGKRKISLFLLAVIYGLLSGIYSLILTWGKYEKSDISQRTMAISMTLIIALFVALFSLYLMSAVYRLVGSWLKGKGSYHDIRLAVGWSFYPGIVVVLFGIATQFIRDPITQRFSSLIYFFLAIWVWIIFLSLLSQAHRFTFLRALGTVAISVFFILILILAIALTSYLLSQQ